MTTAFIGLGAMGKARLRKPWYRCLVSSAHRAPIGARRRSLSACRLPLLLQGIAARLAAFLQSDQAPAGCSGPLLVQNRTAAVAEQFAAATPGCQAVRAVAELSGASLIFSCLANDEATDAVRGAWKGGAGMAGRMQADGASGCSCGAATSSPCPDSTRPTAGCCHPRPRLGQLAGLEVNNRQFRTTHVSSTLWS